MDAEPRKYEIVIRCVHCGEELDYVVYTGSGKVEFLIDHVDKCIFRLCSALSRESRDKKGEVECI